MGIRRGAAAAGQRLSAGRGSFARRRFTVGRARTEGPRSARGRGEGGRRGAPQGIGCAAALPHPEASADARGDRGGRGAGVARRRGTLACGAAAAGGLAAAARRPGGAGPGLVPHRQRGAAGGNGDPARSGLQPQRERRTLAPPSQAVPSGGSAHRGSPRRSAGLIAARRGVARAGRGGAGRGTARGGGAGSARGATGPETARASATAVSEIHLAGGGADPGRPQRSRQ